MQAPRHRHCSTHGLLPSTYNTVRLTKAPRYKLVEYTSKSTDEGMSQASVEGSEGRLPEIMSES